MIKTVLMLSAALALVGCRTESSDSIQAAQQERILMEGTAQVGMPAIKNFRERRIMKMILELRDQEGLTTYTYLVAQQTGKLSFLCTSVGYAINDATGFTNPLKLELSNSAGHVVMPQAEPSGLYTPDNSNNLWVLCADPATGKALPVSIPAASVVSPFKLE